VWFVAAGQKRPAARIPGRLFAADAGRRKRGRAALHQPRCRWASYRKVIVAPVTVWQSPATANIHDADLKAAADYLYAQLRNELGKDFELVDQPGPDTLCVEAALTGAKAANQTMVVVSSVVPIGAAISGSYEYVTGKPTFQGQAAAEARVTDAQSGAVLVEAVDQRMGGRALNSATTMWTDANNILTYWAQQLCFRLCELQERTGCVPPQTGGL
jgi:hypothetical protein